MTRSLDGGEVLERDGGLKGRVGRVDGGNGKRALGDYVFRF